MIEVKAIIPEGFASNMYLIHSDGEYAVVDPSVSYEDTVSRYPEISGKIKYVLLTHAHFDHILEIDSWVNNTHAAVLVGKNDKEALSDPHKNCYAAFCAENRGYFGEAESLSDGDEITLGKDTLRVIETPGHTQGSVVYLGYGFILSGDTVFAMGYGRYDLPGGDYRALFRSIRRICELDGSTAVYSGHGESSTIEKIKMYLNI